MWRVIALLLAASPTVASQGPSTISPPKPPPPSSEARPAPVTSEPQPVVVVIEAGPDGPHLAGDAVSALERVGLLAEVWDPSAFFAAQPTRCSRQVACLCSAPALKAASQVLVLRVSRLSARLRAVDLRRVDCEDTKHSARLSVVVDAAELLPWVQKFGPRLMLAAHAGTR